MLAVKPAWTAIAQARDAIGLAPRTLLHAGPPFDDVDDVVTPIVNSAILAAMYEGWAENFESARDLVLSGEISFEGRSRPRHGDTACCGGLTVNERSSG